MYTYSHGDMAQNESSETNFGAYTDQDTTCKQTSVQGQNWSPWITVLKGVLLTFLFLLVLGVCVTVSAVIYALKPTLHVQEYDISIGKNLSNEGNSTTECAQHFYLSGNDSDCRLLCEAWMKRDDSYTVLETILTITSALFCLSSCVVLAVVAFTVQRDEMMKFPKFYLVYASLTIALIAFFILVGYVDKTGLFCSSNDLLGTFKYGTPFCSLSGIIFVYGLQQLLIWTMFHALGVSWIVAFPIHYRSINKLKSIHIVTVTVALMIPAFPALLQLAAGSYRPYYSPPRFCNGTNFLVTYWTLLLPSVIILAVTVFALMVVFWIILKGLLYKLSIIVKDTRGHNIIIQFGKAEIKILCVICYYVSLGVFVLLSFTYFEATHTAQLKALMEYLECQLPGLIPNELESTTSNECGEIPTVRFQPFYAVSAIGILHIDLIPVVILGFTVRCSGKLHCCNRKRSEKVQYTSKTVATM